MADSHPAPLPSWRSTPTRDAIVAFLERVMRPGEEFVPPEQRVAVFDNDGTLWWEKPLPIQAAFFLRRVGEMAQQDPSLSDRQPWKAVVEQDYAWLSGVITRHYQGDDGGLKLMAAGLLAAYAGSTIEAAAAGAFLRAGANPVLHRPYLATAYQPMVELLHYLAAAGFTTYIASGGGRDFMRPIMQQLYGVPPERVIGSTVALEYRDDGDVATIVHKPELDLFDDGPIKPVRIWSRIGRRPLLAAGNSNGDLEMLRFTYHPSRPSLGLLVKHDDEAREPAYVAGAERVLLRAEADHLTMISVKHDWATVFADPPTNPHP